jgi:dihydroorotate dehydrogenase
MTVNKMRAGIWGFAKKALFHLDAETIHRWSVRAVKLAEGAGRASGQLPLKWMTGSPCDYRPQSVLGMDFRSRLGLAAGFDKNAEILAALPYMGFGYAEIGTVTPRPQQGNPTPRLFRDPGQMALFNRMGFNNWGSARVAQRIRKIKPGLPENFRVGVNLGKNKDTPLENSAEDYVKAAADFEGLADYLVINVSSPNTPGLRSLQTEEGLKPIVGGVMARISNWERRPPLLLKLAPEVSMRDLQELIPSLEGMGIDGWILTNTLAGQWTCSDLTFMEGGWSGKPLLEISAQRLVEIRSMTSKPIISVGGIITVDEAVHRILLGADLIQIYSGWIYQGPSFPSEIVKRLLEIPSGNHSSSLKTGEEMRQKQVFKTQEPQTKV